MNKNKPFSGRTILVAVVVVLVLIMLFSSYTIVEPGNRGVVVFLGDVEEDNVLPEGFHLVLPPLARQVTQVNVRTQKIEIVTEAASKDLQAMVITAVLNYHVDPAGAGLLFQQVGLDYENVIIAPAIQEALKAVTASYRIEEVLVNRAIIKDEIASILSERLGTNQIIVDQFSLQNVEFSEEYNQAIERKQIAEQGAQQKEYELQAAEMDIQIAIANAEAEKEAAIRAAEGRAIARQIEAEAEAQALALIAEQLRDNPALIQYEWATRLSPSVNTILLPADQEIILGGDSLITSPTVESTETITTTTEE